jgi:hypothetical protein
MQSTCHTILSSVACLAVPSLSSTIFEIKIIEEKMHVLISTNLSETFLVLRRIQRDIINVHASSCKVSFILVTF